MKKVCSLFVLASFFAGCASVPKDDGNKAILKNSKLQKDYGSHSLMFDEVNDVDLKIGAFTTPNQAIHYVNPGQAKIEADVTFTSDKLTGVMVARFTANILLEKGETYTMDATENGGCITMSIFSSNNKLVYGPVVRPWYVHSSNEYFAALIGRSELIKEDDKCTKQ
jgi:hypothetical protein